MELTISVQNGKIFVEQGDSDADDGGQLAQPGQPTAPAEPKGQPVKDLRALVQIVAQFVQSASEGTPEAGPSPFDQGMQNVMPGRAPNPTGAPQ